MFCVLHNLRIYSCMPQPSSTKNSSAKYVSCFITVGAMCRVAGRTVAVGQPRAERFIAAEGRKEHLGRGYIGRGLLGIGRKSKYGDQNNVPGNLAVKSTLRKYCLHSPLLLFRQPFHPNSDLASVALAYPYNRKLLQDMLPGNSQIDRIELNDTKTRQVAGHNNRAV